jgi:glutathione peroxidase
VDQKNIPMIRLLKTVVVIALLMIAYIAIVNRNSMEMSTRQKVLKAMYPFFTGLNRLFGTNTSVRSNPGDVPPVVSLYELQVTMIDGTKKSMADFKGKKLLIVNTASDCGYTRQYEGLQALYEKEKGNLEIIAFPANDFKEQEKGTAEDIATFCKRNYGVSFPLASKSVVVKADGQDPVFQWLTDPAKNGWNSKAPAWNFSKYLISADGTLLDYFDPAVEPDDESIAKAVRK